MRWITGAISVREARAERLPAASTEGMICGPVESTSGFFYAWLNRYTVAVIRISVEKEALKIKVDWISGLLVILLIATVWAFFTGIVPYPYGWIVLLVLLVMRLTTKQKQE